jgi:hypothetical protein
MSIKLSPLLQAAVTFMAIRVLASLNLPCPTMMAVAKALNVSRSRASELAGTIEAQLPNIQRPAGRPKADQTTSSPETAVSVITSVRDFLMAHPGAVDRGVKRAHYSDAFRLFAIDLFAPGGLGHGLPVPRAAELVGVPVDTLRQWLREPKPVEPVETGAQSDISDGAGVIEQTLALWERWSGTVTAFRDALRDHHYIELSWHLLRSLLELGGHRKPKKHRKSDAEAIRGALERFFPGAQLMLDGKHMLIELQGTSYAVNWELAVDADTGAHVGFHVSATEDSVALIEAVDMAITTMDHVPVAVLADNKPSNHGEGVAAAMAELDVLLMPSTPSRPENKATVEGAFGLFAQTMPDIILSAASPRQLVSQVVHYVLWAYCAGRNQAPQSRRRGKSAIDMFGEADVSDDDIEAAKARLLAIKKRILANRKADQRREDPVVRTMMVRAFDRLGLADPEGQFVAALARLGLGPALEAVAVFTAKKDAGRLPTDFPERYLLGIAHNVAAREEDLAVYHELLRLRTEAHERLLDPLLDDLDQISTLPTIEFIGAVLEHLRLAKAVIDRRFWMARLIDAFASLKAEMRDIHGPWLAKRVACIFGLPRTDRDSLIAALATATVA